MGMLDNMMGAASAATSGGGLGSLLGGLGGDSPLADLAKSALGSDTAKSGAMMAAVMGMVQKMGGLPKVIEMFQHNGLGGMVQSWLSTGDNAAMQPAQVDKVFGGPAVASVAEQAGVSPDEARTSIASMLPELLNKLSPKGSLVGEHSALLQQGMALFGRG